MTSAIVSLIILALIAFWCIRTVNDFKKKEIRVQEGLSGIEVALTKRYDMLVKMLVIAKGYMTHESELFTKVIELSHGMSIAEMNDAQQQMDALRGKIFAVAENYPELHIAYYQVDPVEGERYKKLSTGEYIYIYSLTFANGLADKEYEWREVFNRIYP